MINAPSNGHSRWLLEVQFQMTPLRPWRWTESRKARARKAKRSPVGKEKTKGKENRNRSPMRKDLILVRVMGTNSQNAWSSKGNSWQNSSWNSGGDNTGKGGKSHKGGKSKDSGKGKDVTCHRCGGHGHYARDCRVTVNDGKAEK